MSAAEAALARLDPIERRIARLLADALVRELRAEDADEQRRRNNDGPTAVARGIGPGSIAAQEAASNDTHDITSGAGRDSAP